VPYIRYNLILNRFMIKESENCRICPINKTCDEHLIPERSDGRRLVTNNPWQCRHLTCPSGIESAEKEIQKLKEKNIFMGYAYFSSKDKQSVRRVSIKNRIIESNQDGVWYSTGQHLNTFYSVKPENYPFIRIRSVKNTNHIF